MPISKQLVSDELVQRREEGCAVDGIAQAIADAGVADEVVLSALLSDLERLQPDPSLAEQEPSDLEAIRSLRPDGPRTYGASFGETRLRDAINGAWQGRAAGCLLGKPSEGWHHDRIKAYLEPAGLYPLDDYFPLVVPEPPRGVGGPRGQTDWVRGRISFAPRDDDTDYTVLGLHILEENGPGFTTQHVAEQWLDHLPYGQVYTAERVTYANLVNGLQPPETASFRNPYREWIGAQIRADAFGYANPGLPAAAAEMAYRDAALSHVKNGIYGEMWIAACLAAAFVESDPRRVIEIGLSEIPARCRLAEAIRRTIGWCQEHDDWEQTWRAVNGAYGHYHVVHTINNACAVALALLHGQMDFERTVAISVMCGWDTDCNGATAGSILGAMLGLSNLPTKWVQPLNDTMESAVRGFSRCRISDLAERTLAQATAILSGEAR